jgi:hypothetical protein
VSYPGSPLIAPSSATITIVVAKLPQVVDFALPTGLVYGDSATLTATSSRSLPVTFASDTPDVCTVVDGVLSAVSGGDCTVTASQAGTSEIEAATSSSTVTIGRAPQVITVGGLGDITYGQAPVDVGAGSDSGLPVTITGSGACAVVDGLLATTGVGACTVTITQAGDARYLPANPVTVMADVAKRSQTLSTTALPALIRGVQVLTFQATSSVGLPVTVTASGACGYAAGAVSVTGLGTCTVTATSPGDAVTLPATVTSVATVVPEAARISLWLAGRVGDQAADDDAKGEGSQLLPGSTLTLTVHSDPVRIATVTVGASGTAAVSGRVPALAEGTHRVVASGVALDGTTLEGSFRLAVDASGTIIWIGSPPDLAWTGSPPDLATTGTDAAGAGILALLWVLAGAGLLGLRRTILHRRRVALP